MFAKLCIRLLLVITYACIVSSIQAQQIKSVKQTIKYYAPLSMSLTEAKLVAAEQARTEALATAFGTIISSHIFSDASYVDGRGRDDFQILSSSLAKGIWLEDIENPKYESPVIDESQNMIMLTVTVHGKVKEIVNTTIDLKVALLRNSTDKRNEEYDYKDGDDMYISFESPVDGNLIVYVRGIDDMVQTLLPLEDSTRGSVKIIANHPYIFFSDNDKNTSNFAGLTLTCGNGIEYNRFYFIFSPNNIIKARDNMTSKHLSANLIAPRELTEKDFRKWLVANMDQDNQLNVIIKDIRIVDNNINK